MKQNNKTRGKLLFEKKNQKPIFKLSDYGEGNIY